MGLPELLCLAVLSLHVGDNPERGKFACDHMKEIVKSSTANDIQPEIFVALIHQESRFKPWAVSRSGACGLTQILPKYTGDKATGVQKLTCEQLKNPVVSIIAGAKTLSYWVYEYGGGNYKIGLCGYNKGFRCRGQTPHPRGMGYARSVLSLSRKIKREVAKLRMRQELSHAD